MFCNLYSYTTFQYPTTNSTLPLLLLKTGKLGTSNLVSFQWSDPHAGFGVNTQRSITGVRHESKHANPSTLLWEILLYNEKVLIMYSTQLNEDPSIMILHARFKPALYAFSKLW